MTVQIGKERGDLRVAICIVDENEVWRRRVQVAVVDEQARAVAHHIVEPDDCLVGKLPGRIAETALLRLGPVAKAGLLSADACPEGQRHEVTGRDVVERVGHDGESAEFSAACDRIVAAIEQTVQLVMTIAELELGPHAGVEGVADAAQNGPAGGILGLEFLVIRRCRVRVDRALPEALGVEPGGSTLDGGVAASQAASQGFARNQYQRGAGEQHLPHGCLTSGRW